MMQNYKIDCEHLLDRICARIRCNAAQLIDQIPTGGLNPDGTYEIHPGGWLDSFWVGMLLHAYQYKKDVCFLHAAQKYQPYFRLRTQNTPQICEQYQFIPLDHDTGFIYLLSQVALYKLSGDAEAKEMALRAANILAERFNETGKFIRAWDTWEWDNDPSYIEEKKGKVIIDSMMNIPLLIWASENGGSAKLREIACLHADTVQKYFRRQDGSFYHTYNFNYKTGEPLGGKTGQGYHDESAWARGQAWAIYGFTLMYRHTGNDRYLLTARAAADYFISHVGKLCVPPWDFCAAKDNFFVPWDSSAGAIAASGLLNLAEDIQDDAYRHEAEKLIWGLYHLCSALDIAGIQPILLHACGCPAYFKGTEKTIENSSIDVPFIFGDYFFLEALLKLKMDDFIPFF